MKKNPKSKQSSEPDKSLATKESWAHRLGFIAVLLSFSGSILLFFNVPILICTILAGLGALDGLSSLLLGKSGTLPAAVAIGAGLLCILAFAVQNAGS